MPVSSNLSSALPAPSELVMPLFVAGEGNGKEPLVTLPGQYRYGVEILTEIVAPLAAAGIGGILVFPVPKERKGDGAAALDANGLVPQALRSLRRTYPTLNLVSDLCFCQYSSHGHCGVLRNGELDNDRTLPLLADLATLHTESGASTVMLSGMIDGAVACVREALGAVRTHRPAIWSQGAKFTSALYGAFRQASNTTLAFSDKASYQLDPANGNQALAELRQDIAEGAQLTFVKPGSFSLDLLRRARLEGLPVGAFQTGGEYGMIMAYADYMQNDPAQSKRGAQRLVETSLAAFKRAGARTIISYMAGAYLLGDGAEP